MEEGDKNRFRLRFRDGRVLETTRDTLCSVPNSVLFHMFHNAGAEASDGNRLSAMADDDGTYFIDRDCDLFGALLTRLAVASSEEVLSSCPNIISDVIWKAELNYWCLLSPKPQTNKKRQQPSLPLSQEANLTPEVEAGLEVYHKYATRHGSDWPTVFKYRHGKFSLHFHDDITTHSDSSDSVILDRAGVAFITGTDDRDRLYLIRSWIQSQGAQQVANFYATKLQATVRIGYFSETYATILVDGTKKQKVEEVL